MTFVVSWVQLRFQGCNNYVCESINCHRELAFSLDYDARIIRFSFIPQSHQNRYTALLLPIPPYSICRRYINAVLRYISCRYACHVAM